MTNLPQAVVTKRQTAARTSSSTSWFHVMMMMFSLFACTEGQTIGVDICSCAPREYNFELDFSLFCPPVNITTGDAVAATTCLVGPQQDPNVADLIPVAVQKIEIFELNQRLQISVQEVISGSFGDGDTFSYESIAALPGEIVDPNNLPRAIQINIEGINQSDEAIINSFLITFTNQCGRFPVLFEGQSAGWTRFVSFPLWLNCIIEFYSLLSDFFRREILLPPYQNTALVLPLIQLAAQQPPRSPKLRLNLEQLWRRQPFQFPRSPLFPCQLYQICLCPCRCLCLCPCRCTCR